MNLPEALNDHIVKAIQIARHVTETCKNLDDSIRLLERTIEGSDLYEIVLSGSQAERTYMPYHLARDEFFPDIDQMYVWKKFLVGTSTDLLNALFLENYEQSLRVKAQSLELYFRKLTKKLGRPCDDILSDVFCEDNYIDIDKHRIIQDACHEMVLIIDDTKCHSGYLRLSSTPDFDYLKETVGKNKLKDPLSINKVMYSHKPINVDSGTYISSVDHMHFFNLYFTDYFRRYANRKSDRHGRHQQTFAGKGPAIDVPLNVYDPLEFDNSFVSNTRLKGKSSGIDMVPAFRCLYWPLSALNMLSRKSASGQPSKKEKAKLLLSGCLIVPTSHKLSKHPFIEWRYSFSECELSLCQSWNEVQTLCYIILKLLKHYYFKDLGISSYHLKTTIFWAVEEFNDKFWITKSLMEATEVCLEMLKSYLIQRNLPNYFIASNNMVDHIPTENIEAVIATLAQILQNVPNHILSCFNPVFQPENSCNLKILKLENLMDIYGKVEGNLWTKYRSGFNYRYSSCPSVVELIKNLRKNAQNFELYLHRMKSLEKDDSTKRFLLLLVASFAHTFSMLGILTNKVDISTKAEKMFKKSALFGPLTGTIQLVHFYVIQKKYNQAFNMIQSIPPSKTELCFDMFQENQDIDILLMPTEMFVYQMINEKQYADIRMWRFHPRVFAKYLQIVILIRLENFEEGFQQMMKFNLFISEMTINGVDEVYISSSHHLSYLAKSLFYACLYMYLTIFFPLFW